MAVQILEWGRRFDWWIVGFVLFVKAVVLAFGAFSYVVLTDQPFAGVGIWNRWDAPHYLTLARNGYSATGEARLFIVFYPLFPWLVRATTLVTGDYFASSWIVVGVASVATGLLFYRLVLLDHPPEVARRTLWFLFIFPTSYFLHIGYTEGLFLALVIGSFLAARLERWWLAGMISALAALTRTNGLLLIPALCAEAWPEYRKTRRWNWRWLAIAMVGVGFGGYLVLNWHVFGDLVAFLTVQNEHWYKSLAWPWDGIMATVRGAAQRPPAEAAMVVGQELFFVALGLIATLICWWKLRLSYSVWMTGNWILVTSTALILSTPRYLIAFFPLFILFALLARQWQWYAAITIWSIMFLALFTSLFAQGSWAF